MEWMCVSHEEINSVAVKVMKCIERRIKEIEPKNATILSLEGELGAGKTTLVRGMMESLGVLKNNVKSPTFILERCYTPTRGPWSHVYHSDTYRLFDENEFKNATQWPTRLTNPSHLLLIEWGEKVQKLFPFPYWVVHITNLQGKGEVGRKIAYEERN